MEWKRSGLKPGEVLRPNADLTITENLKNLIDMTYVDETDAGILVKLRFKPAKWTGVTKEYTYNRFISWLQLYCGAVILYTDNGERIIPIKKEVVS